MAREEDWDAAGRVVGWRLKCCRLWAGLPIGVAAEKLGCARNSLRAWESNARQLPLWRLLEACRLYGVNHLEVLRAEKNRWEIIDWQAADEGENDG